MRVLQDSIVCSWMQVPLHRPSSKRKRIASSPVRTISKWSSLRLNYTVHTVSARYLERTRCWSSLKKRCAVSEEVAVLAIVYAIWKRLTVAHDMRGCGVHGRVTWSAFSNDVKKSSTKESFKPFTSNCESCWTQNIRSCKSVQMHPLGLVRGTILEAVLVHYFTSSETHSCTAILSTILALVTFEPRLLLNNDEVYTIIIMADYVPIFPHRIAPKFRLFPIILDFLWQFWWHGTNDQLFRIKNKNVHILRKIMWLYCHYSDRLYQHLNYLHVLSFHCH